MDLAKILRILAFGGAIAAGILCVYFGIEFKKPALFVWAVLAFFGGVTGFIYALAGRPDGSLSGPSIGAKFTGLPDWVTFADLGLLVVAIVLSFVIH